MQPQDRVFEADYALMPLEELAAYIAQHKHLPGVPGEAEMLEQGVNLGEMQATLLQKIEELTLHVMALKQENDRLKARISNLEQQK